MKDNPTKQRGSGGRKVCGVIIGRHILLPAPINFVRLEGSNTPLPIQDLTDDELKGFGDACTAQLINHARSRR